MGIAKPVEYLAAIFRVESLGQSKCWSHGRII